MLKIRTFIADSSVHGLGLFAAEDISRGDVIWRFTHAMDQMYSPRKLRDLCKSLDEESMGFLFRHIYKKNNKYFLLTDNARFINHSDISPNIAFINDTTEVAIRDIRAGEELLENYTDSYDHDDPFFFEVFGISVDNFVALTRKEKQELAVRQDLSG